MINLLPPDKRSLLLAAKSNSLLIRYCFATLALAVLLALLTGLVYVVLINSQTNVNNRLAQAEVQTAKYSDVQKQADEYRNNLSVAKTILSSGTDFSKIIIAIARDLPSEVSLSSLSLSADSLTEPMSLEVVGNDEHDAIRLKTSFEESELFNNVYIESITRNEETSSLIIKINITLSLEGIE